MKARSELTVLELTALYEDLNHRLSSIGIETQPAVATSILDLTQNPDAGMQDYARIIRNDPGLTGRLIRLSNSAFFAQRKPVTSIDRACVLLGMARVRSIALGFYLSRAAAGEELRQRICRETWGRSVFRACLAAELARALLPAVAPEAFVIGLMLDAGIPLAHRLLGPAFEALYAEEHAPTKCFNLEFSGHPFTHVDIIATMVRRWKFPDLLAKPIAWHHTPPPKTARSTDPLQVLYRIAYYTGAVSLRPDGKPMQEAPIPSTAESHLAVGASDLGSIVTKATDEYDVVLDLFADVAEPLTAPDLADRVHAQLIGVLDSHIEQGLADASRPKPQQFRLGNLTVMLRPEEDGQGMAFSYDSAGEPLSVHRFRFAEESAESLREALGLEPGESDDLEGVTAYLQQLAA